MSQYSSRRSVNDDDAELAREQVNHVPLAIWDVESDFYTDSFATTAPEQKRQTSGRFSTVSPEQKGRTSGRFAIVSPEQKGQTSGRLSTESLTSISVPLRAMHTTQPFVVTLQSTMKAKAVKIPLVIPGSRQRSPQTGKLPQRARRLHPSIRLGLVVMTTLGILLFTLFSLSPLGSSQNRFAVFDGAIKWAQEQQITWDGMVTRTQQNNQAATTGTNTTTSPTTNPPGVAVLPQGTYVSIARQSAVRYGIDPNSFVRQIQQESHFDPNAVSPSGAVGIAQFIPSTAASIGVNPYDPVSALDGAARLMASLSGQFGGDYAKALAAYNAGPGAVQSAVSMGGMMWLAYLPLETQNYVHTIMG